MLTELRGRHVRIPPTLRDQHATRPPQNSKQKDTTCLVPTVSNQLMQIAPKTTKDFLDLTSSNLTGWLYATSRNKCTCFFNQSNWKWTVRSVIKTWSAVNNVGQTLNVWRLRFAECSTPSPLVATALRGCGPVCNWQNHWVLFGTNSRIVRKDLTVTFFPKLREDMRWWVM